MRFVTYNLRFDAQPDSISVAQSLDRLTDPLVEPKYLSKGGEQPWSLRRMRVAEHLLSEGAVLCGFQEALVRQVRDLAELFGDGWAWVGVGRDDGKEAGEFSPIFYDKAEFKFLAYDTFWTSPTPFTPSRFPGAGSFRICTTIRLQSLRSSKEFVVSNTHLDDQSDGQRQLAASLILHRAKYEEQVGGCPVFVLGDFNSPPTGRDSAAYEIITGARQPVAVPSDFLNRFPLSDNMASAAPSLRDLLADAPRRSAGIAAHATFTGFSAPNITRDWKRIDFAFGSKAGTCIRYKVDSALGDDGVLESDHRPVFVDLVG
ncbi:Endo/exonuclease/phosphatase domain-containing protein, partial [Favolaschia claudopus]